MKTANLMLVSARLAVAGRSAAAPAPSNLPGNLLAAAEG